MKNIPPPHYDMVFEDIVPEFGNALGGVLSATQALRNGAARDPDLRRGLLGDMEHNLQFLRFLFDNSIYAQAMRNPHFKPVPRRVDASAWLSDLLPVLIQSLPASTLEWSITVQAGLPAVQLDTGMLEHALGNLVFISAVLAPPKSRCEITAATGSPGSGIELRICRPGRRTLGSSMEENAVRKGIENGGLAQGLGIAIRLLETNGAALTTTAGSTKQCFEINI